MGQFEVSLKIKTENVREMKIRFLQHPQGLLEIQKNQIIIFRCITGIGHFLPSNISMPVLYFDKLFFSKSRVNIAQIFIGNRQGSSPLPASLQVGQ